MAEIAPELLQRIAARAGDPMRRTFTSGAEANARPFDLDGLVDDFRKNAPPQAQGLLGALGKMQSMFAGSMPRFTMMGPGGPMGFGGGSSGLQPLRAPPGEEQFEAAAKAVGRPLPVEVRQLYRIADGGFGPGGGLLPLEEAVARYVELTREPYGPLGQDWPKRLFPLFDEDPVLSCIDLDNGEMIAWDPEEIEDEDSDEDWQRSFKPDHPGLGAMLEQWLGEPTFEEQVDREMKAAQAEMMARGPSPVTGYPMQLPPAEQAESEITFLSYASPSLRADFGLPETGWEDEVRRRHGLL